MTTPLQYLQQILSCANENVALCRDVALTSTPLTSNDVSLLTEVISLCSLAKTLDISYVSLGGGASQKKNEPLLENLMATIGRHPSLTEVKMADFALPDSSAWSLLQKMLDGNSKLRKLQLKLNGSSLSSKIPLGLFSFLSTAPLTSLTLEKCNLRPFTAKLLGDSMSPNCKNTLRHFDLSYNEIQFSGMFHLAKALLKNNCVLQKWNVRSNQLGQDASPEEMQEMMALLQVTELDISLNKLSFPVLDAMCRGLEKNTNLRHLDISEVGLRDEGADRMMQMLKINPNVTQICARGNQIEKFDSEIHSLTHLDVRNNNFSNLTLAMSKINSPLREFVFSDSRNVSPSVPLFPFHGHLTRFEFCGQIHRGFQQRTELSQPSDISGQALDCILRRNPKLNYLSIEFANMGTLEVSQCVQTIQNHAHLKTILFSRNLIGFEGVCQLMEMLQHNGIITHFDISYNVPVISGKQYSSEIFAKTLKQNRSLTHLNISGFSFGPDFFGAPSFTASLSHFNCTLRTFIADSNIMSTQGGSAMVKIIQNNTSLTHLSFSYNNLQPNEVRQIEISIRERNFTLLFVKAYGMVFAKDISPSLLRNAQLRERKRQFVITFLALKKRAGNDALQSTPKDILIILAKMIWIF